jgi:hypothetical protein
MKLDDIQSEWSKDCNYQEDQLDLELLEIPKLHHKYFRILSDERLTLAKLNNDSKVLYHDKYQWISGKMSKQDMDDRSWEPYLGDPLKADIPRFIEADKDVIKLNLKIAMQKEKVEFLTDILKSLNARGFNIGKAIEFQKLMSGAR